MRRRRRDFGVAGVAAFVAGALLTVSGCRFGVLGQHVRTLDANGYLRGTVSQPAGETSGPVVVFAVRAGGAGGDAVDWVVLSRPGPDFLVVPVGEYRVGAFVDRDHTLTLEEGEPAAWFNGGEPVVARPGETTAGLNLGLTSTAPAVPVAVSLVERTSAGIEELPASRIGELVTLDAIFEVQHTALDADVQATLARIFSHSDASRYPSFFVSYLRNNRSA